MNQTEFQAFMREKKHVVRTKQQQQAFVPKMEQSEHQGEMGRPPGPLRPHREGQRRRWRGLFGRRNTNKKQPLATPDTAIVQPVSNPLQAPMSLVTTPQEPCDTEQAMESDPPSSLPQEVIVRHETPPLVAEKPNEDHAKSSSLWDGESSFEALQMNRDFIHRQQAIMDQIMIDQSPSNRSRPSEIHRCTASRSSFNKESFNARRDESFMNEHHKTANVDTSFDSRDDFLRYLNDSNVVEEQRRIMETIISATPYSTTGHCEPTPRDPSAFLPTSSRSDGFASSFSSPNQASSSTRHVRDEIIGFMEDAASTMSLPSPRRRENELLYQHIRSTSEPNVRSMETRASTFIGRRESGSSYATSSRIQNAKDAQRPYTTQCEQDALVELYQGKKIQVRGTNSTWKSIAKGKATLVQCPVCFTILQVGSTAKLLFCTKCNEVSPIGIKNDAAMDYRSDGLIAVVVQQQEVDVAFAKKMAKNDANK